MLSVCYLAAVWHNLTQIAIKVKYRAGCCFCYLGDQYITWPWPLLLWKWGWSDITFCCLAGEMLLRWPCRKREFTCLIQKPSFRNSLHQAPSPFLSNSLFLPNTSQFHILLFAYSHLAKQEWHLGSTLSCLTSLCTLVLSWGHEIGLWCHHLVLFLFLWFQKTNMQSHNSLFWHH